MAVLWPCALASSITAGATATRFHLSGSDFRCIGMTSPGLPPLWRALAAYSTRAPVARTSGASRASSWARKAWICVGVVHQGVAPRS
jgi:hypothetical protein